MIFRNADPRVRECLKRRNLANMMHGDGVSHECCTLLGSGFLVMMLFGSSFIAGGSGGVCVGDLRILCWQCRSVGVIVACVCSHVCELVSICMHVFVSERTRLFGECIHTCGCENACCFYISRSIPSCTWSCRSRHLGDTWQPFTVTCMGHSLSLAKDTALTVPSFLDCWESSLTWWMEMPSKGWCVAVSLTVFNASIS